MYKTCPMKNIAFSILFILINSLFCQPLFAQENSNASGINRKKWEKIAERYDYNKEKEEPKIKEPKKKEEKKLESNKSVNLSTSLKEIIKYALFAVVILILIFIGYKLLRNGKFWSNKKIEQPKVYTLDNLEENLNEADINSFLDEALKNNDFRLSVRLMYLNIIKELSQNGFIEWKRDKTNGDYLRELRRNKLYRDFKKCTLAYEFIWFNEQQGFDRIQFDEVRPDFEKLLGNITKSTKQTA